MSTLEESANDFIAFVWERLDRQMIEGLNVTGRFSVFTVAEKMPAEQQQTDNIGYHLRCLKRTLCLYIE